MRTIKHDTKGLHNFLDIAYCTAHNCYFALQKNNTILVGTIRLNPFKIFKIKI